MWGAGWGGWRTLSQHHGGVGGGDGRDMQRKGASEGNVPKTTSTNRTRQECRRNSQNNGNIVTLSTALQQKIVAHVKERYVYAGHFPQMCPEPTSHLRQREVQGLTLLRQGRCIGAIKSITLVGDLDVMLPMHNVADMPGAATAVQRMVAVQG